MDSIESNSFNFDFSDNSRLLSESSLTGPTNSFHHDFRTGPGGDDLSLSELSIAARPVTEGVHRKPKFSLLAQPRLADDSALEDEDSTEEGDLTADQLDVTISPEEAENARRAAAKTREEKLQHDLYILKKLNAAFEVYKSALRETKGSTERVAEQLVYTNGLLDKYINILAKSEKATKLILDEQWEGAEADEDHLEREKQEIRHKREEEERARLERERVEREEQEREKEERERVELANAQAAQIANAKRGSGVRGVRGTRSSARGIRGTTRGATRGASSVVSSSSSGTINRSRPGSVASTRNTSSIPRGGPPRKV